MSTALKYSLALHLVVFLIFFLQFPYFRKDISHEMVIAVDIVSTAKETNLKNSTKASAAKSQKTQQDSSSKQKAEPVLPKVTKVDKKKDNIQKIKEKSQSQVAEKIKKPKDDIDSLLKDLEGNIGFNKNGADKKTKDKNISTKLYDSTMPLSLSERDSIKTQIERKFVNTIAMDFRPQELVIKLKLTMNPDGTIKNAVVLNSSVYAKKYSDTFVTLKNNLIRAAYIASPIENLPHDKYHGIDGWEEIELTFDAYFLMNAGSIE